MIKDLLNGHPIEYVLLLMLIMYLVAYTHKGYKISNKEGFSNWFWSVEEESPIGLSKGIYLIFGYIMLIGLLIFTNI